MHRKGRNAFLNGDRVAMTSLLKLLYQLNIHSADPMHMYGGSTARFDKVIAMLQAGFISDVEAKAMLGLL